MTSQGCDPVFGKQVVDRFQRQHLQYAPVWLKYHSMTRYIFFDVNLWSVVQTWSQRVTVVKTILK